MSGGYASSSSLLQKQADLKIAQAEYDRIIVLHQPQTATGSTVVAGNAMSNNNGPPPGIAPGEDFGQYWKAIKDTTPIATKSEGTCETAASYDSRLFRKIVYTGVGNLSSGWDKQCYGLIYNAPADTEYNNRTPSYYKTITPVGGYTKLGIDTPSGIAEAAKISDLEKKINGLVYEIVNLAPKATDSALSNLQNSATASNDIHSKIAKYMNDGAVDISNNNFKINQTQNRINVYDEINSQVDLKVHKSKFVYYAVFTIIFIVTLLSYASPLPLKEQIGLLIEFLSMKWWTGWGVITFVTILLILSSFGWDMRGNIAMIFRYITDTKFWIGELWWIGISLLVLIIVYLYTSFKQFFTAITPSSME